MPPPASRSMDIEEDGDGGNGKDLKTPPADPCAQGCGPYWRRSLNELLFTSKLNILMLTTPFAWYGVATGASDIFVFTTSLLAIAPFAERLSFVTEQLALHTSSTIGGLLNATFGNVTELIVSLFALKEGLLRIVQVRRASRPLQRGAVHAARVDCVVRYSTASAPSAHDPEGHTRPRTAPPVP